MQIPGDQPEMMQPKDCISLIAGDHKRTEDTPGDTVKGCISLIAGDQKEDREIHRGCEKCDHLSRTGTWYSTSYPSPGESCVNFINGCGNTPA